MGTIRNSIHNIERNAQSAANSAASAAQSSATTARAAQSAATGAWVGAGFQAATAFQMARAARAAEESLEIQRANAERDKQHKFAMWSDTANGSAFVAWREQAISLAQLLRNRDAEWLSAWARVIGRAQEETPEAEKRRFLKHHARVKQTVLRIAAIVSFVLAALFAVSFSLQTVAANLLPSREIPGGYTYEQCLADLQDPQNFLMNEADCEAISPHTATPGTLLPLLLFLGLGVLFVVLRRVRRRAVKADLTVPREAESRIGRWGFDPLAVQPGYAPSAWYQSQRVDGYADRLMHLALHGHVSYPTKSQLIPLTIPRSRPPSENYPAEINKTLERFLSEQPQLG